MNILHHSFYKGHPVAIIAGYDRVLTTFFMYVQAQQVGCPDANPATALVYSNWDDVNLPKYEVKDNPDYFKQKLIDLNIAFPPDFFPKVVHSKTIK